MTLLTFAILLLTAIVYAALAVWRFAIGKGVSKAPFLALAFSGMALWALLALAPDVRWVAVGDICRPLAWLIYLHMMTRLSRSDRNQRWLWLFEGALGLLILVAAGATILILGGIGSETLRESMIVAGLSSRLVFAIFGIIYVHNLYRATHVGGSAGFRTILIALGILWAYEVNLYTITLLGYPASEALLAGRALLALLLAPMFAIAARRKENWRLGLSRQATFQSLSLIALGTYFVGMSAMARTSMMVGGALGTALLVAVVAILSTSIGILICSSDTRAWLKIFMTKHLFSHRYDYRNEWLRFSMTIGDASDTSLALEERVVKSIADVMDSPAGLLILADEDGRFEPVAHWNWRDIYVGHRHNIRAETVLIEPLSSGLALLLDEMRPMSPEYIAGGGGLLAIEDAWIAVPLLRANSLIGMVVLARPRLRHELDWEDFDLLKVIAQQAAVHIADAHSQRELEEARRFEEFNRRFAFIVHDIKNLVSQLSLVASNAREHGANPRFQADMTVSLTNAVQKMTGLLSRLSVNRDGAAVMIDTIDAARLIAEIAKDRAAQHPVVVNAPVAVPVQADPGNLKLAIDHLLQNAIEASPPDIPVLLSVAMDGKEGRISITDRGGGMSDEFIRKELFKPFLSTKAGGFGIGAAEAKGLVIGMGGSLRVNSVEGEGTQFVIALKTKRTDKAGTNPDDRAV